MTPPDEAPGPDSVPGRRLGSFPSGATMALPRMSAGPVQPSLSGQEPREVRVTCTCGAEMGEWVALDDRCDWCLAGLPDTTREREE